MISPGGDKCSWIFVCDEEIFVTVDRNNPLYTEGVQVKIS